MVHLIGTSTYILPEENDQHHEALPHSDGRHGEMVTGALLHSRPRLLGSRSALAAVDLAPLPALPLGAHWLCRSRRAQQPLQVRLHAATHSSASAMQEAGDDGGAASSRDAALQAAAEFIASDACRSVCILTGAGVSVAAGIPDFRSPGGMYATLRPELITATERQRMLMASDPTYVVETSMFFANQFPYLEVRRPFILGTQVHRWKATIGHRFVELLHRHGKLTRLYTQNIDGLDYQTAVPSDRIVPVHGTIGKVQCEKCGAEQDYGDFCDAVKSSIKDIYGEDASAPAESSNIACVKCGSPTVKPATVLFGGSLPEAFFRLSAADLPSCDLLIIAGTSLVVSPANSLATRVPPSTRRLVINNEPVGRELGLQYGAGGEGGGGGGGARDSFIGGDCDASFLELTARLGWLDELGEVRDALPPASQAALDDAAAAALPPDA
jgi:NAD-dependent deacetylase sirtuin 2